MKTALLHYWLTNMRGGEKVLAALGCRILATDCPGNRDVLAGYEKWEVLSHKA